MTSKPAPEAQRVQPNAQVWDDTLVQCMSCARIMRLGDDPRHPCQSERSHPPASLPELSDKDGWVYDPDDRLRQIREDAAERAAFEKWARGEVYLRTMLSSSQDGVYQVAEAQTAWRSWQARAALIRKEMEGAK